MVGTKKSKERLNRTLKVIADLLNKNGFDNWFIGYGTLLGIVRNGSCIDGDDDIDIVIDRRYYNDLKAMLIKEGFAPTYNFGIKDTRKILKTKNRKEGNLSTVDYYMAVVDESSGDYNDEWEKVVWSGSQPFIKKPWNGTVLNLPNNYIKKLEGRYGKTWKRPRKNYKGPTPRKKRI